MKAVSFHGIPALRQAKGKPGFARAGIRPKEVQNQFVLQIDSRCWTPAPQGHFLPGAFAGVTAAFDAATFLHAHR